MRIVCVKCGADYYVDSPQAMETAHRLDDCPDSVFEVVE